MPNHVENDLEIRGDAETLRPFVAYAEGPAGTAVGQKETELLSAQRFIPFPPEYQVRHMVCPQCGYDAGDQKDEDAWPRCPECDVALKDWYNRGGYDWCCEHWGTKWGLYDVKATDAGFEDGHIGYFFRTAWAPPTPVIEAMSKRFPSLEFKLSYFEGGMDFQGVDAFRGGEVLEHHEGEYHGDRGG